MSGDVEAYGLVDSVYDDSADDAAKQKFISYSAVLITMVAFIFSCIGISKGSQKALEKTLYTFSFPYFSQRPRVENGMVVSIGSDSKVFTGAGVTLSRNVTFLSRDIQARNIITLNYDHEDVAEVELIFAASLGFIHVFEVSYDDIALSESNFPIMDGNKNILPEGMHWMDQNHIVILGNGKIFMYKVDITKNSRTYFDVKIKQVGNVYDFSKDPEKAYSHSDTLNKSTICMSWEDGDDLYTDVAKFNFASNPPTLTFMGKIPYAKRGAFHKVTGFDMRDGRNPHYMVARVGTPDGKPGPIEIAFVMTNREGALIATNYTQMPFSYVYGYFEMDNLNRNDAIMCYSSVMNDGIRCTLLVLGMNGVTFGSHLTMHSGGAATYYTRMKLMVINGSNFGLLYADSEAGGAIVWAMGGKNDAGDLVRHGPEFVVSLRGRDRRVLSNYIGVSRVDENKVAIVELVRQDNGDYAFLHSAFLYPRPLGIAQRTITGTTQVQFGGIWNTKKHLKGRKLVPGHLYYCNDRGNILRGGPHGYMNRNFGVQYVTSREDESLLSLHNQVGIAVSEYELLVRFR